MPNPGSFADTVKQQADIVRVIGEYVKLKKAGAQNFIGLCPFHNEKTPSFSVHVTRQFFHCFGCGVSGDVFSFVQKLENITFPEAVRVVAQKLGIALPQVTFSSESEARAAGLRTKLLDLHERACTFFQDYLRRPDAAHAREYLAGRGLNDEMIARFRIGYAPDSGFILKDRFRGEFDEELLKASGLFSWKESEPAAVSPQPSAVSDQEQQVPRSARDDTANGAKVAIYSKFRNRIVFPITNESGRVIAFTGRTLATDEKAGPKYLNSPETAIYSKGRVLFNLDRAKEAIRRLDYAILVEGQMDCIAVFAAGFHNVIASSGTAFTEMQARLLGRFSRNVVVNFDPDTAGAKATERTLGLLVSEDFQIKVLTLEAGFDPDLYIRRKGKDAYAAALRGSQKYFDYLIARAQTLFPVRSADGKVKAVNFLLPHIQRVSNRIARDELAGEIAQKLAIDSAVLRQELRHAASTRSTSEVKATAEAQVSKAEQILIRALASATQMQEHTDRVSQRDGGEEGFDPAREVVFALRTDGAHTGLGTQALLEKLLDGFDKSLDPMSLPLSDFERNVLAAALLDETLEITAEEIERALRTLKWQRLERRQEQLTAAFSEAERRGDNETIRRLLTEKVELQKQMRKLGRL
jgi:DNA primase